MVFSSISFFVFFLPLVLLAYYVLPRKLRNYVLLVFSLVFYAWGEPYYVGLMVLSIVVNFIFAKVINSFQKRNQEKWAKCIVWITVIFNLGLLGFFKYSNFLVGIFNGLFRTSIIVENMPLPIGISFYTFQIMSYTIDVYRKEVQVQNNIFDLGTYITMFPQLIAGPIVRYQQIADELTSRKETLAMFSDGIKRFCIGLGKKVLLANQIGAVFIEIFNLPTDKLSIGTLWLGMLAFTFQIYFDFSGYSDMAIGLGMMFGFNFPENFNYPYIAGSITEFWRRWHITLGIWFKEYVYFPLGGNRKGKLNQIRNILIVWFLTGLWHGASWNYIIWGIYFGTLLIIEKTFLLDILKRLPGFVSHIYALIFIVIGWILFAFDNWSELVLRLRQLFFIESIPLSNELLIYYIISYGLLFIICIIASTPALKKWKWNWLLLILSIVYLAANSYNPFLYFRF